MTIYQENFTAHQRDFFGKSLIPFRKSCPKVVFLCCFSVFWSGGAFISQIEIQNTNTKNCCTSCVPLWWYLYVHNFKKFYKRWCLVGTGEATLSNHPQSGDRIWSWVSVRQMWLSLSLPGLGVSQHGYEAEAQNSLFMWDSCSIYY